MSKLKSNSRVLTRRSWLADLLQKMTFYAFKKFDAQKREKETMLDGTNSMIPKKLLGKKEREKESHASQSVSQSATQSVR